MISVSLEGATQFRAAMAARVARLQNLEPAFLRAGAAALKAGQQRIDAGGGSEGMMPPNLSGTPLLHATGRLFGSLSIGAAGNTEEMTANSITVGTNVQVNGYNLGELMQGGTGIYAGHSVITANASGALSFMLRGARVTVKSIKGSPQRRFLYIDDAVAQTVMKIFASYVMQGSVDTDL